MTSSFSTQVETLFRRPKQQPCIATRGVHLDLKGMPPTFPRLLELLQLFAKLRFNLLLIEWEDAFPWKCDSRFASRDCYTPEQVRQIGAECERLGIELVPLVQSLGHAENVLSKKGYEALREVPERSDVFHPLHPDSPQLVLRMVRDVLELLPQVKRFHLGGDEVYTLGQHPASVAFVAEHGHEALYLRQLEPTLAELEARGVRPLLWHDEFVHWSPEQLEKLSPRVDMQVWGYSGDPTDSATYHHRLPHAEKLSAAGCKLWAVTAHKGADGPCTNVPDPARRQVATLGWMKLNDRFKWEGVITSAWSRYSSGRSQADPLEGAMDSLVNSAVILHDGELPQGGIAACRAWLSAQEHSKHCEAIRATLEQAQTLQDRGWSRIRQLEEQVVNLELEPARAGSGVEEMILDILDDEVSQLRKLEAQGIGQLKNLVPDWCARNFFTVRIEPIARAAKAMRRKLIPHTLEQGEANESAKRVVAIDG